MQAATAQACRLHAGMLKARAVAAWERAAQSCKAQRMLAKYALKHWSNLLLAKVSPTMHDRQCSCQAVADCQMTVQEPAATLQASSVVLSSRMQVWSMLPARTPWMAALHVKQRHRQSNGACMQAFAAMQEFTLRQRKKARARAHARHARLLDAWQQWCVRARQRAVLRIQIGQALDFWANVTASKFMAAWADAAALLASYRSKVSSWHV